MDGQDKPIPIAVVWRELLRGIFPTIGRLALLAQCLDSSAALYSDDRLAEYLSPQEASSAISAVHELIWQDWVKGTFEAQRLDLLAYLNTLPRKREEVLSVWTATRPYLNFIPKSATHNDRELFANRMQELLACLANPRSHNLLNLDHGRRRVAVDHLAGQVLDAIHERYTDPNLSLKTIASHLHVSEHHLGKLFRNKQGLTFRQYLRQVRMQRAILLLQESHHGIKTVCSLVGYQDLSHFTHYFRQATGTTPAEFRNEKQRRAHSA